MENANRQANLNQPTQPMYTDTLSVQKFQEKGWNLFGVMRNDMDADSQLQKLLNVDVFGRSMIANIFGPLKRGDHVGLALKQIRTDLEYNGFVQPSGNILPSPSCKTALRLKYSSLSMKYTCIRAVGMDATLITKG